MSPLAVVPNVSSIAVISSSAAGGGFEVGSGDLGIDYISLAKANSTL